MRVPSALLQKRMCWEVGTLSDHSICGTQRYGRSRPPGQASGSCHDHPGKYWSTTGRGPGPAHHDRALRPLQTAPHAATRRDATVNPAKTIALKTIGLMGLIGAACIPALTGHAQTFPTKPIRIVVPFAPGTAADMLTRLVGTPLAARLGQPVIIDNRPGATGNIGAEQVARSE